MTTYKLILLNEKNVLLGTFPLESYGLTGGRGILDRGKLAEHIERAVKQAEDQGDEAGIYANDAEGVGVRVTARPPTAAEKARLAER